MDKKTKKELKRSVKYSRKRLEQIDDPTAWIAIYSDGKSQTFEKGEFERLQVKNASLKATLAELKEIHAEPGILRAENSILKAQLESINNGCTNRLEDGYPKGYSSTYSLEPGEAKIFYGKRVEASDFRVKVLEAEIERLETEFEVYKA